MGSRLVAAGPQARSQVPRLTTVASSAGNFFFLANGRIAEGVYDYEVKPRLYGSRENMSIDGQKEILQKNNTAKALVATYLAAYCHPGAVFQSSLLANCPTHKVCKVGIHKINP